jgi:hypothetical protein
MPYRLESSSGLLTVEFSGTLTRDELFAALREMEAAEQRLSTAPDRLFLLLDVLEWHIVSEDIRRHAEQRRGIRLPNPIRSAIVVSDGRTPRWRRYSNCTRVTSRRSPSRCS